MGRSPRRAPLRTCYAEFHPSDHLPVKAKLRMRGMLERMETAARAWIVAVLEGTVDGIPLNRERLQLVRALLGQP